MRRHRWAIAAIVATLSTIAFGATSAVAVAPVVTIDPASEVGITTAKVQGTIDPGGAETYYHFEYATQAQFEASEWGEASWDGFGSLPDGTSGATAVGPVTLGNLAADTTYHLRLVATSNIANETAAATAPTFETSPATAPGLALDPAEDVAYTTAHIAGTVDPEGGNVDPNVGPLPISWELQISLDPGGEGWQTAESGTISAEEPEGGGPIPALSDDPIAVAKDLENLQAGKEYSYRLLVSYAGKVGTTTAGSFETGTVALPTVTIDDITDFDATTATFSGSVNPNAPGAAPQDPAFNVQWSFNCTPTCAAGLAGGTVPGDDSTVTVGPEEATGLEPNTDYSVTLRATNAGGTAEAGKSFKTPAVPASVKTTRAGTPSSTEARLNGWVNPHNSPANYWFEWGTSDCSANPCSSVPLSKDADAGSGNSPVPVARVITGLEPGVEYHYRLVADNGIGGPVAGEDVAFSTTASASCPNEARRLESRSSHLAECRAYEMVSPPDKNGADIPGEAYHVVAAAQGGVVAYSSRGSFGDTIGSGNVGWTQYVARRGADGWTSRAVTPTPAYYAPQVFAAYTKLSTYSADLSRGVVFAWDLPAVDGDLPEMGNIYVEDTRTRELQPVTKPYSIPVSNPSGDFNFSERPAASRDARHIAFKSETQLLAEAPLGTPSVYEWEEGSLRLASVLPNGELAPAAVMVRGEDGDVNYEGGISPDGLLIPFFSSFLPDGDPTLGVPQLYARVDHSRTAWVSEPETSDPSGIPQEVAFQHITGDSRHVIFTTTSSLVDEDENGGRDIYLYTDGPDPAHEDNLTLVTASGDVQSNGDGVGPVIGSSDDGARIYILKNETITLWDRGNTERVATNVALTVEYADQKNLSAENSAPGGSRVSPDGRYLAFWQQFGRVKGGGSNPVIGEPAEHSQWYHYDADTEQLRCVACPSGAAASVDTNSFLREVTDSGTKWEPRGVRPNYLLSDGTMFFNTAEPLVAADVNGVGDAYEFDPATDEVALVSSGKGSTASAFIEASPNGEDIFIITRQQLVQADRDNFVDLYDARADGGFVEPVAPAACDGDACQGAMGVRPAEPPISSSLAGRGNVEAQVRRCGKRKSSPAKKQRRRCAKAKPKSHPKRGAANNNRRTSK